MGAEGVDGISNLVMVNGGIDKRDSRIDLGLMGGKEIIKGCMH